MKLEKLKDIVKNNHHIRYNWACYLIKRKCRVAAELRYSRELQNKIKARVVHRPVAYTWTPSGALSMIRHLTDKPIEQWDVAALLKLMWGTWNDVFRTVLGRAERSLVNEIRDQRNKWAHQDSFSSDDADRTLDSVARLLTAVSASQADEVNRMKMELRRLIFEEQARSERRRGAGNTVESQATGSLKPWREGRGPASRRGQRRLPARPSSPRTCGRSISVKEPTSTATQQSSFAAPI